MPETLCHASSRSAGRWHFLTCPEISLNFSPCCATVTRSQMVKAWSLEPSGLLVLRAPVCHAIATVLLQPLGKRNLPLFTMPDRGIPKIFRTRPPRLISSDFDLQLSLSPSAPASLPVRSWRFKVPGSMFDVSVPSASRRVTSASRRVTRCRVVKYDRRQDPATLRLPSFPGLELRPHP